MIAREALECNGLRGRLATEPTYDERPPIMAIAGPSVRTLARISALASEPPRKPPAEGHAH